MTIGEFIKVKLTENNLNQEDLGRYLKVSKSNMTRKLNGERQWTTKQIKYLKEFFKTKKIEIDYDVIFKFVK